MEKRSITIICVVIYLLIAFSLGRGLYHGISGAMKPSGEKSSFNTASVWVKPVHSNQAGSEEGAVGYMIHTMDVNYKTTPVWYDLTKGLLVIPVVVLIIIVLFRFAYFIHDILKKQIFTKLNIKRMWFIGISFFIFFLYRNLMSVIDYIIVRDVFRMENYELAFPPVNSAFLWASLVMLLFAEIFALGMRLKEEQELTI